MLHNIQETWPYATDDSITTDFSVRLIAKLH